MATPTSPSAALVRTARNEIERIDRSLTTIEQRRAVLVSQIADLDSEAEGYTRRRSLLAELVQVEQVAPTPVLTARRAIKGAELRRVAGHLLWRAQRDSEVHYREWFERVIAEGYAIGGKDPVASFLTNMRDSPAVIRGSKQGHYRLDPSSRDDLAQQIGEAQAELADVEQLISRAYASAPERPSIERLREHRDHLKLILKRFEGKMSELDYIFDDQADDPESTDVVGTLRAA